MDGRVTVVDLLGHHGRGTHRRGFELWPINYRRAPINRLRSRYLSATCRRIPDRHLMNLSVRSRRDALDLNALVDDRVVVHDVIIDDRGVVIDLRDLGRSQPAMADVVVVEVSERHEREMFGAQTKIEIDPDVDTIKAPPETGNEFRMRWHRRPAAMVAFAAPDHPGRRPNAIGHPDPAAPRVQFPASIMERSPTPGVTRLPVPAGVAVNPVTAIAIRAPGVINHHDTRLPAPAVAF